jgi:tellurite resistance protein
VPDHPPATATSAALARLAGALAEDALFALASGVHDADALEGLLQRRAVAHGAALQGDARLPRMLGQFDAWVIDMTRALAPIAPPSWIPMMEVVREKVTLEIGARGLRSLFSTKPSDRDIARVKRYGGLAVRVLRAVLAADGPLDAEERTTLAAVVASLGLPDDDAGALLAEPPVPPEILDIYGELDLAVVRAIVRGASWAAAADGIDPREDHAIRVFAQKAGVGDDEVETARREAQERVESRSKVGAAALDAVRFVLSDRAPGEGVRLAALVGALMIPRRWRSEALTPIGQGAPVTLARRHSGLASSDRLAILGVAWAGALLEDPSVSRRALLQARWEKFAADLGEDDPRARELVGGWVDAALASSARGWA